MKIYIYEWPGCLGTRRRDSIKYVVENASVYEMAGLIDIRGEFYEFEFKIPEDAVVGHRYRFIKKFPFVKRYQLFFANHKDLSPFESLKYGSWVKKPSKITSKLCNPAVVEPA